MGPKTEPMGGPGGHPGHHHHQQAHGQQQPTKSMVVSIPLPSSTSTGLQASEGVMQPASSHKKHKKEKKNKKDKREKGDRKHKSSSSNAGGEIVSVSGISVSGGQSTGSESGHGHHRSSSSS